MVCDFDLCGLFEVEIDGGCSVIVVGLGKDCVLMGAEDASTDVLVIWTSFLTSSIAGFVIEGESLCSSAKMSHLVSNSVCSTKM